MSASVDNAASTIKDNLDQGLFDWDVTHDELTENNRKVAELSPRERNELISKLSDDDLKNWTQEIDGMSGALTASERDDLFRDLAAGLDGKQVTRLVDAFDGSPQGREALGNAIAQHSSSDAKVAFINATKDSINGDYSASDGRDGNAETVVLSKVLGSLRDDPAKFDSAVKSLSDSQLQAVMTVGLGRQHIVDFSGRTAGTDIYRSSASLNILDGAAKSSDPEVKGRVFEAATGQFQMLEGGSMDKTYTDAVTKLVKSDPVTLVDELKSRTDLSGKSLTAYLKEMLGSGNEQDVRNLLVQMQQGNDGKGNAYERFADPNLAHNLGFFAGATAAAINSIADDAESQGDLLKNIFGAGFGAAGAANPAAGVIASVGNGITSIAIDDIINNLNGDSTELKRAIFELGMPRGPDGKINPGPERDGAPRTNYDAGFAAIAEVNR
jgi:hypothetical protein